eukprot:354736-Chlamydomonas_euryale.AAC.9
MFLGPQRGLPALLVAMYATLMIWYAAAAISGHRRFPGIQNAQAWMNKVLVGCDILPFLCCVPPLHERYVHATAMPSTIFRPWHAHVMLLDSAVPARYAAVYERPFCPA